MNDDIDEGANEIAPSHLDQLPGITSPPPTPFLLQLHQLQYPQSTTEIRIFCKTLRKYNNSCNKLKDFHPLMQLPNLKNPKNT